MRKIKKILLGITATAVLLSTAIPISAFAKNEQIGNNSIRLYGNTMCKEEGHTICIDVWAHGKTITDLRKAPKSDYADIIVYRNETTSGKDGAFEITFSLDDRKSGIYDAYISCSCGEEIVTESVIHSNPDESKKAIGLLNEAAKSKDPVAEIKKVCNEYSFALGFVSDYEFTDYAAELIADKINDDELEPEDKEGAIAVFDKATAVSAIRSGELTNILDAEDELRLDDSDIAEYYKKDYVTDTIGTYLANELSEKKFNSFDEFDKELNEKFVLGVVKYADGWGAIVEVVNAFSSEIGEGKISKDKALKVMGKDFSSADDLADALGGRSGSSGSASTGSGSGSGGGGGGSSIGGGGGQYSEEYVNPGSVEKINKNIFDDIDSVSWATEAIVELAQKGIVSGREERLFFPNDNITREEVVKLIVLSFYADAPVAEISFADVEASAWYSDYVKQACGIGIVKGIGDNLFGTGMNITREDMVTIAYRAAIASGKLTENKERSESFVFEDDSEISDYAAEAVYALYDAGVINGVTADTFAPSEALTRAQAAKIIYYIYTL